MTKSLLGSLMALLFIHAYLNGAAYGTAPKPTRLLVYDVDDFGATREYSTPFNGYFGNFVIQSLPNFNVKETVWREFSQDLAGVNYVLIASYIHDPRLIPGDRRLMYEKFGWVSIAPVVYKTEEFGLNKITNKAYILIQQGLAKNPYSMPAPVRISFNIIFNLNWDDSNKVFYSNATFENFKRFLENLNNSVRQSQPQAMGEPETRQAVPISRTGGSLF